MKKLAVHFKWLADRNALILYFFLVLALCRYAAGSAALCALYAVLFPWSLCQAYRLYLEGKIAKDATWKWVWAYLGLYALSACVTRSVDSTWPLTTGTFLTASLFMLYISSDMSLERIRDYLFSVGCFTTCVYLPLIILALVSVYTGHPIRIPGFSSFVGIQTEGSVAQRIRIFANTNIAAQYVTFNLLFSIYAILVKKNKLLRAFFGICILIYFAALAHTQSRTCMIAFSFAIGLFAFRSVCMLLKNRRWRMVVGAAACLAVAAVLITGLDWVYKTDINLAHARYIANHEEIPISTDTSSDDESDQSGKLQTRAEEKGQFDVYSSGRGDIWPATVNYLIDHPKTMILGMGRSKAMFDIAEEYPKVLEYAHLHNSFLACLTYCGLPFLICILGFLCTLVPPAWKMFMQPSTDENRGLFIVPVFIATMLMMAVPEEMLFLKENYPNLLFYLLCGFVLRFKHLQKSR